MKKLIDQELIEWKESEVGKTFSVRKLGEGRG